MTISLRTKCGEIVVQRAHRAKTMSAVYFSISPRRHVTLFTGSATTVQGAITPRPFKVHACDHSSGSQRDVITYSISVRNIFLKIFQRKKKLSRGVCGTHFVVRRSVRTPEATSFSVRGPYPKRRNGLYLSLFFVILFHPDSGFLLWYLYACTVRAKRPSSVSVASYLSSSITPKCMFFLNFLLQYCHVPDHDKCMTK